MDGVRNLPTELITQDVTSADTGTLPVEKAHPSLQSTGTPTVGGATVMAPLLSGVTQEEKRCQPPFWLWQAS